MMVIYQGTASSRAIVFDTQGHIVSSSQKEFTQYSPKPGCVEHDPEESWSTVKNVIEEAIANGRADPHEIAAISNASRTMLFNFHTLRWDAELLEIFHVPEGILPDVKSSSEVYGETGTEHFAAGIPIAGIAGDQQAALFGQIYTSPGKLKNTYGTGGILVLNRGDAPVVSHSGLLATVAWQVNGSVKYALEGSIFISGAAVQWLRDGLGIIRTSSEIEELALSEEDNGGVCFVPAFVGLGAPHWDKSARGTIVGITRGTTKGHIARAALESMAFQTCEVVKAMEADSGMNVDELRVDGGATVNDTLMQFQSDLLGIPILRPKISETTALGAAYLAGLAVGYWKNLEEIETQWEVERRFEPKMNREKAHGLLQRWSDAVDKAKGWLNNA